MTKSGSLRERKKQRTKADLIAVSQRLFNEQGYEATTLEQICDEAEVSVPTLLAYFESKERLALAGEYDSFERLREAIADPDREEDTISIWRRHVLEGVASVADDPTSYVNYQRFISSTPTLLRRWLSLIRDFEDVIADGLAADYGTDPHTDLPTRLLATMLSFGMPAVVRQWINAGATGDLVATVQAVIDFAVESFPKPGRPFVAVESAAGS